MEKINTMSLMDFIFMGDKAATSISILAFLLSCIFLNWLVTLQELYSGFGFVLETTCHLVIRALKGYKRCENDDAAASSSKPCTPEQVENEILIKGDVEIMLEKLRIFQEPNGDKLQERLGLGEISTLFNENEPSLEEVKEAFDIFDENKDGYIDAKDLEKLLSALGFVEISGLECQRMIEAFDLNGDRRIDFIEFLKIIENSFC